MGRDLGSARKAVPIAGTLGSLLPFLCLRLPINTSQDLKGCPCLSLSKAAGELSAFLASLFGPCEKMNFLFPEWLENRVLFTWYGTLNYPLIGLTQTLPNSPPETEPENGKRFIGPCRALAPPLLGTAGLATVFYRSQIFQKPYIEAGSLNDIGIPSMV